jgi:hypothetical protein
VGLILTPDDIGKNIRAIEQRLDRLERSSPFGDTSVGAGLGFIRTLDAGGQERTRVGRFADGSDYGIEIRRADGTLALDSKPFDVMKQIATVGTSAWTKSTVAGTAGPPTGISGLGGEVNLSTVNFTLSRAGSVKIEFVCSAGSYLNVGGVSTNISPIYFRVQGQANSVSSSVHSSGAVGAPDAITCAVALQVLSNLPAGTYTCDTWWNSVMGANARLDVYGHQLSVFRIGS